MENAKFDDEHFPEYQKLRTAMNLLFLREDVINVIAELDFRCSETNYCLTHHLIGIAKGSFPENNKFSSVDWSVSKFLNTYYTDESSEMKQDIIELLKVLLIHLHSAFRNKNCNQLDWDCNQLDYSHYFNQCVEKCPMHNFFSLMVYESHNCSPNQAEVYNVWEKNTICQFFHINLLFQDLDISRSQDIAGYPPFIFELKQQLESGCISEQVLRMAEIYSVKSVRLESNVLIYKDRIGALIKDSLRPETDSPCANPACEPNNQNFSVIITNQPNYFLLQINSTKDQISHLISLLSTLSISHSLNLNEVYSHPHQCKYQLFQIVFAQGTRVFSAWFNGKMWKIEGLSESLDSRKFLEIVMLMKLVPSIVVYQRSDDDSFSWPQESVLHFLEQVAVQADWASKDLIQTTAKELEEAVKMSADLDEEYEFNKKIADGIDFQE